MPFYKENMLNKIEDDLEGRNQNWKALDKHVKNIADEFDETKTYAVGDYAIYENVLYRCVIEATGEWNPDNWIATSVGAEIASHLADYETHKTEIANKMKNFEIVAQGSRSGIAVSIDLPTNSTYLFLMGRDGAVYFIHRYGTGDIVVTPIVPFSTNLNFNISGGHLEIDFGNRGRHYVLVRLS